MWGTGNGEVTFTHDVALAFLCYEMSPSEPLFSHLQNVNGLPAPQDPLGISWADARRVLGTEEVTKCCSLISPPPCPPAFSLRTSPLLSCLGLTLSNWSIQTTLTQSSQLHFKTPPLFSWVSLPSWFWSWWVLMVMCVLICGPRMGACVGCLWLAARLKTGSKLAVWRWSFAPEIHYRFKPILKMHL